MIYVKFKNYNGAGVNYNSFCIKTEDWKIINEIQEKENDYHAHMPGNGYCSFSDKTSEYNDLKLIEDLIENKLRSFIKPKFIFDSERRKTDFQRKTAKELKNFKFDGNYFNHAYKNACNTELYPDYVHFSEKELSDEQETLIKLLKSTKNKISRFDEYKER